MAVACIVNNWDLYLHDWILDLKKNGFVQNASMAVQYIENGGELFLPLLKRFYSPNPVTLVKMLTVLCYCCFVAPFFLDFTVHNMHIKL